jgi:hypothetical protein
MPAALLLPHNPLRQWQGSDEAIVVNLLVQLILLW